MAKKFSGKVALVTGASSGIGRGGALLFAREGAKVLVVADSNVKGGEETVKMIKDAGGEAAFFKCDVTREAEVAAMVAKAVGLWGRLDYAFNNAGIGPDGPRWPLSNIVDMDADYWNLTIGINLTGAFLCIKHEMKQMFKQKYGSIVNTSSIGGVQPPPGFCAYGASKGGLNTLTKSAALEGAPFNVRVNTVMPGPIDNTNLFNNLTSAAPGMKDQMQNGIPLHRVGHPEDIAEAVMYFCSDAASFVTGQVIAIDGGMTLG